MANYVAAARTNYFHVKDMEAFAAGLPADIEISRHRQNDPDSPICLKATSSEGWPALTTQRNKIDAPKNDPEAERTEDLPPEVIDIDIEIEDGQMYEVLTVEFDIAEYVRGHLAENQIAYGMEVGREKLRYIKGLAWATDGEDIISLDLEDEIRRQMQKEFGDIPESHAAD